MTKMTKKKPNVNWGGSFTTPFYFSEVEHEKGTR